MSLGKFSIVLILIVHSALSCAANIFNLDVLVGPSSTYPISQTASFGFNTAQQALESVDKAGLSPRFTYVGTENVNINLDYRGLGLKIEFPANSAVLSLNIPSLNIKKEFTGVSRDASAAMLSDFFKAGDIIGQVMKHLSSASPVDPIAGNPNSLMSQMVANDFQSGFSGTSSNIAQQPAPASGKSGGTPNLGGLGLRFGNYHQNKLDSKSITLPLTYTIRSDIDPRRQLTINVPISQTDVLGAKSYYVGAGVMYRFPLSDNWSIAPSFQYALTGSIDLGSIAQIISVSLTNSYLVQLNGFDVSIGNMVGYYKTLKFTSAEYSFDPGISNTVFRNGAMVSMPIKWFARNMSIEYSLIDTRFMGTALFMPFYDEVGITIGTNKGAASARSYLRAGITYMHSVQTKGFALNLGYWF